MPAGRRQPVDEPLLRQGAVDTQPTGLRQIVGDQVVLGDRGDQRVVAHIPHRRRCGRRQRDPDDSRLASEVIRQLDRFAESGRFVAATQRGLDVSRRFAHRSRGCPQHDQPMPGRCEETRQMRDTRIVVAVLQR
jgi:hypothetical protein